MTMMMKLMLLHWSVDLRLELGSCRCVALPHIWARDNFSIQESNRITEHHVCPSFISTSRSSVSWWTQQKPHYTSVQVVSLTVYSSLCGGTWSMQQRNLCKTCLRCTCFKLSTWAQPWWSTQCTWCCWWLAEWIGMSHNAPLRSVTSIWATIAARCSFGKWCYCLSL